MRHLWLWCRSSPGLSLADFPRKLDKDCRHLNEICCGTEDGRSRHSWHFAHNTPQVRPFPATSIVPFLLAHLDDDEKVSSAIALVLSHTLSRKRDLFNRLMSIIVGARRSPAQTVGLRIRVLVSWPSHTPTSFPNARLSIRTGEHGARLARWCSCIRLLQYVCGAILRMGWRKDSIVCPALCSDSRPCMSLNHLLVSCCSVVVDYEGIIQCACFSRSMIAT